MTDTELETLIDNLFDKHAKKIGDYWVREDALDRYTVCGFARELLATVDAARKNT